MGPIMVTEPFTTPPTHKLQLFYAALVAILTATQFNLGPIYSTPELALVIGNIVFFFLTPHHRLFLTLKQKKQIADSSWEFVFTNHQSFSFKAGQYLEWTLPHANSDLRGNRRYFTIASSPTEQNIRLSVRIPTHHSTFKHALLSMNPGEVITAAQLGGDFTLPQDTSKKLIWIAGGIGVTPFRSMAKYLNDTHSRQEVTLFYACKTAAEIAYQDIFSQAEKNLNFQTIYLLTQGGKLPKPYQYESGRLDTDMLKKHAKDYAQSDYYISGPSQMVDSYIHLLKHQLNIPSSQIKTDYFPGF